MGTGHDEGAQGTRGPGPTEGWTQGWQSRAPNLGPAVGAPAHLDPRHSLLQAEAQDLAEAAGIGVEDCLSMAKTAEQGQHGVQLGGRRGHSSISGRSSPE